jgi:hypothetical protein
MQGPGENSPLDAHINVAQSVHLNYNQNDLAVSFSAIHFSQPEKNQYSFRLLPYDESWSQPSTNREAVFTNLDPGIYTLEVKGSNSDGIWNETPIRLEIIISPAWWQTWWAYALYFLLFSGAVWTFVRWRLYYIRLHYERETALAQASAADAAQ